MSTHRAMLFDHCVITVPVTGGTACRPNIDACFRVHGEPSLTKHSPNRNNWLPSRRNLPRAIVAGFAILLLAAALAISIGMTPVGPGQDARIPLGNEPAPSEGLDAYRTPSANEAISL